MYFISELGYDDGYLSDLKKKFNLGKKKKLLIKKLREI